MAKKILVTDDSPHVRTAIRSAIEKRTDWIVYEAEHGGIAVLMVGTHKPHLLMLDFSMPVMKRGTDKLIAASIPSAVRIMERSDSVFARE